MNAGWEITVTWDCWSFDFDDEETGWHLYVGPFCITRWRGRT